MLGEEIKTSRKELGLSLNALARKSGLDPARVYNIETGRTKDPQFSTVCKLANALGISLDELEGKL